jgi:hypothetical protein
LEKRLTDYTTRYVELDILFKQVFEQGALGKISEDRVAKLTAEYEEEQYTLDAQMSELREQLAALANKQDNLSDFITLVRKSLNIKRLTASLLNQFVDFIKVYQAERKDGRWIQRIDIHYAVVGKIDLPIDCGLPESKSCCQYPQRRNPRVYDQRQGNSRHAT